MSDLAATAERLRIVKHASQHFLTLWALDHLLTRPGAIQRLRNSWRRMPSVRFRVSRSAAPISSSPAPAMSEARTRCARVTRARFDRVGGVAWVMGAFRD